MGDYCRVLARFDANSYCPEWMRGSISSECCRVCKKNAINSIVSSGGVPWEGRRVEGGGGRPGGLEDACTCGRHGGAVGWAGSAGRAERQ